VNFDRNLDRRLLALSQDDWQFVWTAVEAGWSTPRIMQEVDAPPAVVFIAARAARAEMSERLRACEHCRRNIASGKREAA
jgi:hypothetical protein